MQEPNQRMGFCVAGFSALKHCLQGRREAYNAPENADKTQKGQEINTTYKARKAAGDSRIHKVPLQGHCLSYVSAAVKKKKTPPPRQLSGKGCSILSFQTEG